MRIGMIGIMAAVMAVGLIGIGMAEDVDDGSADPSAPLLVMSATQNDITIENLGTDKAEIGGLRLITKNGNVGTDVANIPYVTLLSSKMFPIQGLSYKIILDTNQNLTIGDKVYLTNGVGNYATAIVA